MKYSIIIPIYKRLEIFNLVLDSIFRQTYKPLEIIIIDNNTDYTETVALKKIIINFKKKVIFPIKYKKSPINSGSVARNIGAMKAKGDLVAFLDSDVVLDENYYESLINYFNNDQELIAIQGLDRSLLEKSKSITNLIVLDKIIYLIEQFFETSVLLNQKNSFVSPSLAVSHPNVKEKFEVQSQWISTCAGVFKKSIFKKYSFPKDFITYSNNEYLMFSYQLYKNNEGKMIYTSKAKYRDLQTDSGRLNKIELMYQIETYDLFIFMRLFELNLKNILIFIKSRVGHLIYYLASLLFKRNFSLRLYMHALRAIIYPFINFSSITKGDLSFYEKDFPIK